MFASGNCRLLCWRRCKLGSLRCCLLRFGQGRLLLLGTFHSPTFIAHPLARGKRGRGEDDARAWGYWRQSSGREAIMPS